MPGRRPLLYGFLAVSFSLSTGSLYAEGDSPRPDGANRDKLLAQFDKDGDGQLSPQEREAARAAMQNRGRPGGGDRINPAELLRKFDKDGDGRLNEQERAAAQAAMKEAGGQNRELSPEMKARILKEFDKDGDGQLNEQERAAAMQHLQKMRSSQNPRGPRPDGVRPPKGPEGREKKTDGAKE